MSGNSTITQNAGGDLRWFDGDVVHAVEGSVQNGSAVFWTLCHRDLPPGAVTDENRRVTCPRCLDAAATRS
jgi:hypothetical protein